MVIHSLDLNRLQRLSGKTAGGDSSNFVRSVRLHILPGATSADHAFP